MNDERQYVRNVAWNEWLTGEASTPFDTSLSAPIQAPLRPPTTWV